MRPRSTRRGTYQSLGLLGLMPALIETKLPETSWRRFRFAYLEEPETVAAKFADTVPLDAFEANCWQLRYDLDRLCSVRN